MKKGREIRYSLNRLQEIKLKPTRADEGERIGKFARFGVSEKRAKEQSHSRIVEPLIRLLRWTHPESYCAKRDTKTESGKQKYCQ